MRAPDSSLRSAGVKRPPLTSARHSSYSGAPGIEASEYERFCSFKRITPEPSFAGVSSGRPACTNWPGSKRGGSGSSGFTRSRKTLSLTSSRAVTVALRSLSTRER